MVNGPPNEPDFYSKLANMASIFLGNIFVKSGTKQFIYRKNK